MASPLDVAKAKAEAAKHPLPLRLSSHAVHQAYLKGWTSAQVRRVAEQPSVTYPSNYDNQQRRCGNGICVVVDLETNTVVTVYANVVETPRRPDQEA